MYLRVLSLAIISSIISIPAYPIAQNAFPALISQSANASELLQQGLKLYQAEKYAEAAKLFEEASQAFSGRKDKLNQALALNYLSLTYQQSGQLSEAQKVIDESLKLLGKSNSKEYLSIYAQTLNTLGRLQLTQGQTQQALNSWEEAIAIYSKIPDNNGKLGSQLNQIQALQALGFYRRAKNTLENIKQDLDRQTEPQLKAKGLLSLGNAERVFGDLNASKQILEESLKVAQQLPSKEIVAEIFLSLGNTAQAQQQTLGNGVLAEQKTQEALTFYQQAQSASTGQTRLQARLNQLRLLAESPKPQLWSQAEVLAADILSQLESIPPSRNSVYARINFAQSLIKLPSKKEDCTSAVSLCTAAKVVAVGVTQAQNLKDLRAESYALGTLGKLYVQTKQWSEAEKFSLLALKLSEGIQAKDISYRWLWQLGKIKSAANYSRRNDTEAIAAYEQATKNFKSLRGNLVSVNRDASFSYQDESEPLYREYLNLLLKTEDWKPSPKTLEKTRNIVESMQLAELDDFFRRACLDRQAVEINNIDKRQQTAVIYPVILSDRLAVILWLPNQPKDKSLQLRTVPIVKKQVEDTIEDMRQKLVTRSTYEFLLPAEQLYDWLIKPIDELDLHKTGINNLVFVLNGKLQNIPMAALYDANNKQYLIQKEYNIALSPSLEILPPQQRSTSEKLQAIVGGVSQENLRFPALPGVGDELKQIKQEISSQGDFINDKFTSNKLENAVSSLPASIVHLATHGQFSSRAEDTFILAWQKQVNVNELSTVLKTRQKNQQQPLELVVFSACRTAIGDNRAALGLAGVAIQSGARSTMGTLWSVDDQATSKLMVRFYDELVSKKKTKAEALRLAQTFLLSGEIDPRYKHPYYWAPYILVGNWL